MPISVCSVPYISDTKLIFFVNILYILPKYTGPIQNADMSIKIYRTYTKCVCLLATH